MGTRHAGIARPGTLTLAGPPKCGFRARSAVDESHEDQRLVRRVVSRAKEGDRDAIRTLYLRYADNVYGYVRSIVRDDHEAEDITQHVFAKLMLVIVKYDERSVPFLGWLLRLAHNAAIDHLRSRRAVPAEEIYGVDERASATGADRSTALHAALAALPADQRTVVVMRHVVGMSPTEIAEHLGRSESSVHGLHHRGRKALQCELRRLESAPSTGARVAIA